MCSDVHCCKKRPPICSLSGYIRACYNLLHSWIWVWCWGKPQPCCSVASHVSAFSTFCLFLVFMSHDWEIINILLCLCFFLFFWWYLQHNWVHTFDLRLCFQEQILYLIPFLFLYSVRGFFLAGDLFCVPVCYEKAYVWGKQSHYNDQ